MNKAGKGILISVAALTFSLGVGTGVYFGIAAHTARENGYISLTDESNQSVKECDLGLIAPGESKIQEYTVKSNLNFEASCTISFSKEEEKTGYEYISVSASLDNETLESKKFSSCFEEPLSFKNKISENESKRLTIKYTLADDVPEGLLGMSLDFKLVFEAKAFK